MASEVWESRTTNVLSARLTPILGFLVLLFAAGAIWGFSSLVSAPQGQIYDSVRVRVADDDTAWRNYLELAGADVSVTDTEHARVKHGEDASSIRSCLDKPGGTIEVWKFVTQYRPNEFFQICQLDDGRYGLRLIRHLKDGRWMEKTSFVVKDGTRTQFVEYITARATHWAGKLSEWVFISPGG